MPCRIHCHALWPHPRMGNTACAAGQQPRSQHTASRQAVSPATSNSCQRLLSTPASAVAPQRHPARHRPRRSWPAPRSPAARRPRRPAPCPAAAAPPQPWTWTPPTCCVSTDWLRCCPAEAAYAVRLLQVSKGVAEPASWDLVRCPSADRRPMAHWHKSRLHELAVDSICGVATLQCKLAVWRSMPATYDQPTESRGVAPTKTTWTLHSLRV
jgi:hypothetical protein